MSSAALAGSAGQDVPGLDGVTVPPITASPTPSPTPKPPRRLLPPPEVVPEPESQPVAPIALGRGGSALPAGTKEPIKSTVLPTPPSRLPDAQAPPFPERREYPAAPPASPVPDISSLPEPVPAIPASPESTPTKGWGGSLPVAGGALVLLLLALGGWLIARRRRAREPAGDRAAPVPAPLPVTPPPAPPSALPPTPPRAPERPAAAPPPPPALPKPSMLRPAAPAAPPALRPWLEIDFIAKRAGTNLTSATVDFELAVRNIGSVPAHDVRVLVQLLTANPEQNAQLKLVFARPTDQPIMAPFALEPSDTAKINAVGTLASDKINRIALDGREMFVPIMAVRAVYNWAGNNGEPGSTANAYILGVGRDGQEKMQPLWLDNGPRMADRVTHRLHEIGVRR